MGVIPGLSNGVRLLYLQSLLEVLAIASVILWLDIIVVMFIVFVATLPTEIQLHFGN